MVRGVFHGFGHNHLPIWEIRYACRVYTLAQGFMPTFFFDSLERACWEETEGEPLEFVILFEHALKTEHPFWYDMVERWIL